MKRRMIGYCFYLGVFLVISGGTFVWAQAPNISIDLTLDKSTYAFGEPVAAEVVVQNDSGQNLFISKGFSSRVYYLDMRVIDPSGRLLSLQLTENSTESPDAPALPFVLSDGKFVRVADCELLSAGWSGISRTNDLGTTYPLDLPGFYSAQVQISVKTFSGSPCNANDYKWLGVLKSDIKYFFLEGKTPLEIAPSSWPSSWKNQYNIPDVEVHIWPVAGKGTADYRQDSIRLNNVAPKRVVDLKPMLKAYFDRREVIDSLGPVEVGKMYPVIISGRLNTGEPFGGSRKVTITH